jgi:AraC-like DNA-binding protein
MKIVRQVEEALEVQNSLAIRALSAGMSIGNGNERRLNNVHDYFELIFVRKGVLAIWEEEWSLEVTAGQSLLLWPHRCYWSTQHHLPELCFFWLRFRVKDVSRMELSMNGEQTLCVPQYANVNRAGYLESLFRRYLDDQDAGCLLPPCANVLAWLMLAEVADLRTEAETGRSGANAAKRALACIHSHCHLPLTASEIADELGYDRAYLSRVFHQTYHRTLTEEIHRSRLTRVRELLLDGEMSVNEIARACGFTDIKYFFRLFRRYEGTTPKAFRSLNGQARANLESTG